MHTGFWWNKQKEKDEQEELDVGRKVIINLT
jgi:hypothetical protein